MSRRYTPSLSEPNCKYIDTPVLNLSQEIK